MKKILQTLSLLLTLLGGFMAFADKFDPTPLLPPKFAQFWPLVLTGAAFLFKLVTILGDFFDNWKLDDSFKALLLVWTLGFILCLMPGCAVLAGSTASISTKYGDLSYTLPENRSLAK